MKRLRLSFALFSLLSAVASLSTRAAAPELPPRIKAPTDNAVFRRFVLDNGIKVLLVSDPKFNKSGASLVCNVGQIDDPKEREGLAHFTEHMLFLGTEKYPKVEEYGAFMKSNGGYNNAYTSSDITNYQFEVRHEAFAEGVDRFAQFFIAPLFTPEFTGREVNAVHNEAMRHVQNDQRRLIGVARELYNPESGESKFSTGTKETLAGATPQAVREFYEKHYSADRMALCLAGKASLDELEKLAREKFSAVPKRDVPAVHREAIFLPKKAALRLALAEPIKELRLLQLEFPIGPVRQDFVSKPDELVTALISYPGPGGLQEHLKQLGLANDVSAYTWERTNDYGSLFVAIDLTPEGQKDHARVLGLIFSYLEHLRASPFPADFYADRARVGQLNETYRDRGEGADLATNLANQALFYPLEVAERAGVVWGKPDEPAYRRLLAALTADNALVALMAKGVPTDKQERIYKTAYSYHEETGAAYEALAHPAKVAAFKLPGANRFMPGGTAVLAERPLPLIDEPGLQLFYAEDTEFQRPQTSLIFRFVPVRDVGTAESAALLRMYAACLLDFLDPAIGDARLAGVSVGQEMTLEGIKFNVTGYGDSAVRYATYLAEQLRAFTVTPQRFDALKEVVLRGLKSYEQTEAYLLARDRRDALTREFYFLPNEIRDRVAAVTLPEVQAFAKKFLARGKVEAIVHGHLSPDEAVAATRAVTAKIGAQPAPADALLRRRHLAIAPKEDVLDTGEIAGVNSAFIRDYVLPDDSPQIRAAAVVLSNFVSEPFYTELRTKQQLGYIVSGGVGGSLTHRYFSFTIQSSGYAPDELRKRADTFIATLPAAFNQLTDAQWATLKAGAKSLLEEKAKSIAEKAEIFFGRAYTYRGDWDRQPAALKALESLTKEQAATLIGQALAPETARSRTVLLATKAHPATEQLQPAFTERTAWKASRKYN